MSMPPVLVPAAPRSGLRVTLLVLALLLGGLAGLGPGPAGAQDQVFTIEDYPTARENLSDRHMKAWKIYEYYLAKRRTLQAMEAERAFIRRELEPYQGSQLSGAFAIASESELILRYNSLGESIEDTRVRMGNAEQLWSEENFDVGIGVLGEDLDRFVKVRHEDPKRPGTYVTTEMNRIEYRLYNGKRLGIFSAPDARYVGDKRSDPVNIPAGDDPDPAACPPCPAGKEMCYCDEGTPICFDAAQGEGCILPTDREACSGPGCPEAGPDVGGINSLLRGE